MKNTRTFTLTDDDGNEYDADLPTKFDVCHRCDGHGKHVNPNVDYNGITSDEWANDWDDESREMYLSGGYDVECYECNGNRVVAVVNEDALDSETLRHYKEYNDNQYRLTREREDELKYGY